MHIKTNYFCTSRDLYRKVAKISQSDVANFRKPNLQTNNTTVLTTKTDLTSAHYEGHRPDIILCRRTQTTYPRQAPQHHCDDYHRGTMPQQGPNATIVPTGTRYQERRYHLTPSRPHKEPGDLELVEIRICDLYILGLGIPGTFNMLEL